VRALLPRDLQLLGLRKREVGDVGELKFFFLKLFVLFGSQFEKKDLGWFEREK